MMKPTSIQDLLKLNRDMHSKVVAGWKGYRSGPDDGKFWPIVYFAIKALKTHESILALAERGLGHDAAILGRAIYETAINALWMSKDLDGRLQQFQDSQYISAMNYRRSSRKWPNRDPDKQRLIEQDFAKDEAEITRKAREAKKKWKLSNHSNWSGLSFKKMVEEVQQGEWYMMYQVLSDMAHSGVGASHDFIKQMPGGGAIIDLGPTRQHAVGALQVAYMSLVGTTEVADIVLDLDLEEALEMGWANVRRFDSM